MITYIRGRRERVQDREEKNTGIVEMITCYNGQRTMGNIPEGRNQIQSKINSDVGKEIYYSNVPLLYSKI